MFDLIDQYIASAVVVLFVVVATIIAQYATFGARVSDSIIGAFAWVCAVCLKVVLAIGVMDVLDSIGLSSFTVVTMLATGLLTVVTECVITLLIARLHRWQIATKDRVIAFGVGFAVVEAFGLAAMLLAGALWAKFASPDSLSEADAKNLKESFSDPARPFTFVLERVIAIPVHLLSSTLIIRGSQLENRALISSGFVLKFLIDAVPTEALAKNTLQAIYFCFGVMSSFVFYKFFGPKQRSE